jgi:hypothetical protein
MRQKLCTAVIDVLPVLALTVTTGKRSKDFTFRRFSQFAVVRPLLAVSDSDGIST